MWTVLGIVAGVLVVTPVILAVLAVGLAWDGVDQIGKWED